MGALIATGHPEALAALCKAGRPAAGSGPVGRAGCWPCEQGDGGDAP
jgi:hypothetical protein